MFTVSFTSLNFRSFNMFIYNEYLNIPFKDCYKKYRNIPNESELTPKFHYMTFPILQINDFRIFFDTIFYDDEHEVFLKFSATNLSNEYLIVKLDNLCVDGELLCYPDNDPIYYDNTLFCIEPPRTKGYGELRHTELYIDEYFCFDEYYNISFDIKVCDIDEKLLYSKKVFLDVDFYDGRLFASFENNSIKKAHRSDVLYIYKGNIRCHKNNHHIIQATAILHNKTDDEIKLNVEYCSECDKYLLEYTLFEQYRNRYGVLIGNLRMVTNDNFNGEYDLALESPLRLSGYNVNQKDNFSSKERHYILARIIYDDIMDKGEVIRYLSYFIRMNGAKPGNENAVSKWEEDLFFVQSYDMNTQPRAIISDVKRY